MTLVVPIWKPNVPHSLSFSSLQAVWEMEGTRRVAHGACRSGHSFRLMEAVKIVTSLLLKVKMEIPALGTLVIVSFSQ